MSYVFDNGPFSLLFKNYYPSVFATLWQNFHNLIENQTIVSCREVAREIADSNIEAMRHWAQQNKSVFAAPSAEEGSFVSQIYSVQHFQHNIEVQKMLKGGHVADPFVIAKAKVEERIVVTIERFKPNAAKIPNICKHFDIGCLSLQEFMEKEGWKF